MSETCRGHLWEKNHSKIVCIKLVHLPYFLTQYGAHKSSILDFHLHQSFDFLTPCFIEIDFFNVIQRSALTLASFLPVRFSDVLYIAPSPPLPFIIDLVTVWIFLAKRKPNEISVRVVFFSLSPHTFSCHYLRQRSKLSSQQSFLKLPQTTLFFR